MWFKFLIRKLFTVLCTFPFLLGLCRNIIIFSFVIFSSRNLLHRFYFVFAKGVITEICLPYSNWLRRLLLRRLECKGFSVVTFAALCNILPGRFLLGVFQKHLTSIVSDPICMQIMLHKGLERPALHDSRGAPFSQIETYSWTLNTALDLAKQGDVPNILNFVRWFTGSPPLTSAFELRQIAETYRKLERMADKLDVPAFSEPLVRADGRLRVGLFRYDYTPQSEGGTGEADMLKSLLVNLPSDISFYYLGMAKLPEQSFHGKPYVKLSEDVKTAIIEVRALELDIVLFTPPIWGSFLSAMNLLIAHRVAKIQVYFAGDVVTSGMPTLDYWTFSCEDHKLLPKYQQGFTERLLNVPFVPPPPPFFKTQEQASIEAPNGLVSYVTNCHVLKMNDALLRAWADILHQVPNSQILLCPYSNDFHRSYAPILVQLIQRISAEKNIDPRRFIIHDIAGPPAIAKMLASGQVYLDSFPYTGSFSTAEALNIGLPSVCLASNEANHMQLCRDIVCVINMEAEIITNDIKSYVQRAVELGQHLELRWKLAARINEQCAALSSDQLDRNYSDAFWKKIREIAQKPH
jgi:hypothetical protein